MSTNPGVTTFPVASISCAPSTSTAPTAVMRPPSTATSAGRGAAPVPSTTRPLRITSSCMLPLVFGCNRCRATAYASAALHCATARLPFSSRCGPLSGPHRDEKGRSGDDALLAELGGTVGQAELGEDL